MPRELASVLCIAFVFWLLKRDVKANPGVSNALWFPLLWLAILASRSLKEWRYGQVDITNLNENLVNSAIDRNVIFALIIVGVAILLKRSISWSTLTANNWAISLYFLYAFASIAWSDFPMVSFTQWHRTFLSLLMAVVVLTEPEPDKAFNTLIRRCGYILIPWSVVLIKYYPEVGRFYSQWGIGQNVGVTNSKNKLGALCMVMGLYFLSSVLARGRKLGTRQDRYIDLLFLGMVGWLLFVGSRSGNAIISTVIGVAIVLILRIKPIQRNFSVYAAVAIPAFAVLMLFTGLYDGIISALGKDPTLTGRTELWADLRKISINPLLGVGYESFWMGDRLEPLWRTRWWHPNEAHNAYYEMYLNLGLVGLGLLFAMILSCYARARRLRPTVAADDEQRSSQENGIEQFRLAFLLSLVLYGWAEASFRGTGFLFFLFILIALERFPQLQERSVHSLLSIRKPPKAIPTSFRKTHAWQPRRHF